MQIVQNADGNASGLLSWELLKVSLLGLSLLPIYRGDDKSKPVAFGSVVLSEI